jgi:DNA-3-methyladenine glycosylase II
MTMMTMRMTKPRGFRLAAAIDFYAGFVPGSGMAAAAVDERTLTLAFRLDASFEAVAVSLREEGDSLVAEWVGTEDAAALRAQLARMLGLDCDAEAWLALGKRDPVVGKLQRSFPGFFTAAKASPYDAAAWGVISPRMSMAQAAKLKMAIAAAHGDSVLLHGRAQAVFPSPAQVLALRGIAGLPDEKVERLRGIARAAIEGRLDANRLRAMDEDDALTELQALRGVGPWTASHILHRGAALPDALPSAEPRVLHAFAEVYKIEEPTAERLARAAEAWRPFRMWVCVLMMRSLHRARGSNGWKRPELARERAAAGRRLNDRLASRPLARLPARSAGAIRAS